MSAKLCPMTFVNKDGAECEEDACAWWHGGMCDVSRIADALQREVSPYKLRDLGHQSDNPLEPPYHVTCVDCGGDV